MNTIPSTPDPRELAADRAAQLRAQADIDQARAEYWAALENDRQWIGIATSSGFSTVQEMRADIDARAARYGQMLAGRMRHAIEVSGVDPLALVQPTGISADRITALVDGAIPTVSEILAIGLTLGHRAGDWFGPADPAEVTR
ncbi:hypothetical protein AB0F65_17650 [Nocardia rhamnosiphila]|uniref:hypothetical protein n=1 Tax=Nocardia rhamnosiphila TaxID=426716 RepID=UPI0033DDE45F